MSFDRALATREILAGNDAYQRGEFVAAISSYRAAAEAGADSADLWFNLGNAYYRAGQEGRAALAFERALRREPGDKEARSNLHLVRAQLGTTAVSSQQAPLVARVGARTDPDLAAGLLLSTWLLACALAIAWLRGPRRRALLRALCAASAGLLLCCSLAAGALLWAANDVRQAGWSVALQDGEAREAPEPSAKVSFPVQEASTVRVVARMGGFAKIELSGGLAGWIEASKLEAIDQPSGVGR